VLEDLREMYYIVIIKGELVMSSPTMITARISEKLSHKLDEVARESRRSRSWVIKEALERYLSENAGTPTRKGLMSYAGAGIKLSRRRTAEEVDAEIRWLRDDD
jgi:predicted transcriptional regulator